MTAKRFEYEKNTDSIWFWKNGMKYKLDARNLEDCAEALNTLSDENYQLKLFKEKVFDLIDEKIEKGEGAIEWGKSMDADYGAMGFHVEMLKLLKKELQHD